MGCLLRSGGFLSLLRCGFTTVTGPLRIQLTCGPEWFLVVFVVSGSFQCIDVFPVAWLYVEIADILTMIGLCVWGYDSPVLLPVGG